MTIIDMHAHIASRDLVPTHFLDGMKKTLQRRAMEEHGIRLQDSLVERIAARRLDDLDCSKLLLEMNKAKISQTVLLIADFGFDHDDGEESLTKLYYGYHKVLLANPDRFIVFGGTDPRRGSWALSLFERGLREFGFGGLKLYPPCGYEIDDATLFTYYEMCEAYKVPILIHTGPSLSNMLGDKRYPASILRAAALFPRVNFVLGHGAFQNFETNLEVAITHRNIYLETSGFQRLTDSVDEVKKNLSVLFDRVPDQIVFGTDWPVFNLWGTQKDWVDYFFNMNVFNETQFERFFWRNAESILTTRFRSQSLTRN